MAITIGPRIIVPSYGALTTAWITATGETDTTILGALNTLESDLTGYGILSKMKALYPFVGGTATKHSYNFINTGQYQITWSGGLTHSSTGVLPGGVNGYGSNGFKLDTSLSGMTPQNQHLSFYSRTNNAGGYDYYSVTNTAGQLFISRYSNGNAYYSVNFYSPNGANSNGSGFYVGTATSSTLTLYRNNSSILTGTTSTTSYDSALNNTSIFGGDGVYGIKECALLSVGLGLTSTEAANYYTAVQAFQTTLGRQV